MRLRWAERFAAKKRMVRINATECRSIRGTRADRMPPATARLLAKAHGKETRNRFRWVSGKTARLRRWLSLSGVSIVGLAASISIDAGLSVTFGAALALPSHQGAGWRKNFVRMGSAPGNDSFELGRIISDRADLNKLGFDDFRVPHLHRMTQRFKPLRAAQADSP